MPGGLRLLKNSCGVDALGRVHICLEPEPKNGNSGQEKKFMPSIQICCLTRSRIFVLESGHPGMRPGVKVVLVDRILSPPSIRGNIVMLRKSLRAGLAVFLGAAWFPAAALSQAPAELAAPA